MGGKYIDRKNRAVIDLQLKLTHVLHSKLTHPCNEDYVS